MAIDPERLLNWQFEELEHTYTERDAILYALGLGLGSDPLDENQLRFVYEDGLRALPTMAVVLGYPGFWLKDPETGVDWAKVLHGEQGLQVFKPLPASGTVIGRTRVTDMIDKGPGKGAILYSDRDIIDKATGELLCRVTGSSFLRGDGGYGGKSGPTPTPHQIPERDPDISLAIATLPQAALIYRLSGDFNPLHADPKVATGAGFKAPILHGLCTYGVVGRALLQAVGDSNPDSMRRMDVRFTSPVYPGETVVTEIWRGENGAVSFRARVQERDVVVINNGYAEFS